jgi:hypothetical protein
MARLSVTGTMDILPDWAVTIIAIAVGLNPGLALLSVRSIVRLLHRALWRRHSTPIASWYAKSRPAFHGEVAGPGVDRSGAM